MAALLAFILSGVLASPLAELEALRCAERASLQEVAGIVERGLASQAGGADRSEAQRCADAFREAEWHRVAASLVDGAAGTAYSDEAVRRFSALRLDFPRQPASWLGYIGEARVYRQSARLDEAWAVLAAVIDAETAAPAAVRTMAQTERLEVELLRDPAAALAGAQALGKPAGWVEARSLLALGRTEAAAAAARRPEIAAQCSVFDRLRLLADSGHATDAEWARWAELWAGAGRNDRALDLLGTREPAAARGLHARLLYEAGRWSEAADRWGAELAAASDNDEVRWRLAVCLARGAADEPDLIPRARAGLLALADRDTMSAERRLDALRWWAPFATPEQVAKVLGDRRALLGDDPDLRYRLLSAELAQGAAGPEVLRELAAIESLAADDPALRAAAVLTYAGQIAGDPGEALAMLTTHRDLLTGQSHTAARAEQLRVRLWVEAGLLEPALDAALDRPGGDEPEVLLLLARALVQRGEGREAGEPFPPALRTQLVRLVNQALTQRPDDESLILSGARVLVASEAWSDAAGMLRTLSSEPARLLRAQALLEMGRREDAWEAAEGMQTPEALALRARWLFAEGQADAAITEARAARAASRAGVATWWEATCVLVGALHHSGQARAAADVLRVAEVLHPVDTRSTLRRRIETLRNEVTHE